MNTQSGSPSSDEQPSQKELFPIVGIGASAGGLEAFTSLLEHMPASLGLAYVLVQHLNPTHESLLPTLLARVTTMPVIEVRDGMPVVADRVYVIPAGSDLILDHSVFLLAPRKETRGLHRCIDLFLCSLARSHRGQAIGVILSGSGSDGTAGIQAIKEAGGMTFAQEPTSASSSGMPQSAIATGYVDRVLLPFQIADVLAQLSHHPYLRLDLSLPTSPGETAKEELPDAIRERAFQQILRLLHLKTGVDFSLYKPTTLYRRLLRRMALSQMEDLASYLRLLQGRQEEVEALYREMLITVTSFFRDPSTFALLKQQVLPRLLTRPSHTAPIRIWVPGCSTGEEVYSLVMYFLEFFAEQSFSPPSLQVFGTDLHPSVIEQARAGIYPLSALSGIEPARITRFFGKVNGNYQISKAVRDLCVFAQQNICQDPPFSRLDLLSCRNVLIYLKPAAQAKVFSLFQYALNPGGFLILGSSETVGRASDLFAPIEKNQNVYVKTTSPSKSVHAAFRIPSPPAHEDLDAVEEAAIPDQQERVKGRGGWDTLKEADHLLLARYAPASVVIDARLEILQFRGHTSPYLEGASGRASLHLLKMARPGLGLPLRTTIAKARKSGVAVKKAGIPLSGGSGESHLVTLEVIPLSASSPDLCFLVLFEEALGALIPPSDVPSPRPAQSPESVKATRSAKDRRIRQMEQELATTREEMQAIIEELEAANEELQSANEEILSSNEELQSVNEELETSKEEIESTNEELLIINQELQQRNVDLTHARDYAEAIIETVRQPLLILNADLRVARANRSFYQSFQMESLAVEKHLLSEVGGGKWNIPALRVLLERILPENQVFEGFEVAHQFPSIGDRVFLLNARRISSTLHGEALILLAFEDVTERMELSQRKDEFIGMAAHELKTPLTSIKTYVHLLRQSREQAGDERGVSILTKIESQLSALAHLIDEMLDINRMETGGFIWSEEVFDLDLLVREIAGNVQLSTERHQLVYEGEGMLPITSDREHVAQVLTNLLSNAIKYSPENGSIVVRMRREEKRVILSVSDQGIGIPKEYQAHMFERFYRVPIPEHQMFPGLGLGLYLCAEIVKRQGGEIWVESGEGKGTTIFFTLARLLPQASKEKGDG